MTLAPGSRLGAYEIVALLGAGGMGEVYRARDLKLGRDVALKVLPASVAGDAERLSRFEREARLLASLNHPHIGAIYGVEESAGVTALVLELVDGDTLAEQIAKGRGPRAEGTGLPIGEALGIARQIADALDAAHERGIVHRDLKPANIKITPDGTVKVLDFGLAKETAGPGGPTGSGRWAAGDLSQSPTMLGPTMDGALLGTAPYMSPEQARGRAVDKRADVWAFGCVLYEMLTGRATFSGETITDVVVAILEHAPDWRPLPANTPFIVRRLLERCLEKDPKRRLRDIGDARFEIDDALAGGASAGAAAVAPVHRKILFQRLTDFVGLNESPALSPDGKTVAFVAVVAGKRQIWVRLLAGGAPLQITRDDADHEQPRWMPDSSALVYYSPSATAGEPGVIWEVSALGGPPRPIISAVGAGDVSHDGQRIAVFQLVEGRVELTVVARDGSSAESLGAPPHGMWWGYPRWSPDDRWLAFQSRGVTYFDHRVVVIPSAGGTSEEIARGRILKGHSWLPDASGVVYSSSAGSTVLYPPTFNLRVVGRGGGGDRPLTFGDVSYVEPDVHTSGKLLSCRIRSRSDIWKFPCVGSAAENTSNATRITHQTGQVQTPSASPDGREVVYLSDSGGHGNLWVARTDGTAVRQITFERDPDFGVGAPVWSPAGNRIAFLVTRSGLSHLCLVNPDGGALRSSFVQGMWACWSGDGKSLYYTPTDQWPRSIEKISLSGGPPIRVRDDDAFATAVAPDGSTLYFATQSMRGAVAIDICRACPEDGPRDPLACISSSRIPVAPPLMHMFVSPDGKWLAMPLTDGATSNLWVLPTDGRPLQPLTDFGQRPIVIARRVSWAPDGRSIYAAVAETEADVILLDGLLA